MMEHLWGKDSFFINTENADRPGWFVRPEVNYLVQVVRRGVFVSSSPILQ
jgi:hypothetical protein